MKVDANLIQKSRSPEYGTLTMDDLLGPPRPKGANGSAKGKKVIPEDETDEEY